MTERQRFIEMFIVGMLAGNLVGFIIGIWWVSL